MTDLQQEKAEFLKQRLDTLSASWHSGITLISTITSLLEVVNTEVKLIEFAITLLKDALQQIEKERESNNDR